MCFSERNKKKKCEYYRDIAMFPTLQALMQHFSCWKDNGGISKLAAIPVKYQVYWLSTELLRIFVLLNKIMPLSAFRLDPVNNRYVLSET